MKPDEKIIKILFDEGKISRGDLLNIHKIHTASGTPMEKLAVQLKVARREDVIDVKSRVFDAKPLLINNIKKINLEMAKNIPQAMAKRYQLICAGKNAEGKAIIAMHNPSDTFALEYVQMRTGMDVEPHVALLEDLEDVWDYIYSEDKKKKHPFFRTDRRIVPEKKIIPEKFTLPGVSKHSTIIVENKTKAKTIVFEAADGIRRKAEMDEELAPMMKKIQKELDVLNILSQSGSLLNSEMDENELIKKIIQTGLDICGAESGSILLLEEEKQYLFFREAVGPSSKNLFKVKVPLGKESIAGWVAIHQTPVAINSPDEDPRHYKAIDQLIEFETKNIAAVPLLWGDKIMGVMEIVNKQDGEFDEQDIEYLNILASQAAVALHNALMVEQFNNFYLEIVEILIDVLETSNALDKDQTLLVARLASAIARELDLEEKQYEDIMYGAFLHDIGKINTEPDNMEYHPVEGGQILSQVKFFRNIAPMVRHHHEKFDGSGLPDGLSGESIPLGARIIGLAERFMEQVQENDGSMEEDDINTFLDRFGTDFDPGLKLAFLSAIEKEFGEEEEEELDLDPDLTD